MICDNKQNSFFSDFLELFTNIGGKHNAGELLKAIYEKPKRSHLSSYLSDDSRLKIKFFSLFRETHGCIFSDNPPRIAGV